jgi:hypothetical protein
MKLIDSSFQGEVLVNAITYSQTSMDIQGLRVGLGYRRRLQLVHDGIDQWGSQ